MVQTSNESYPSVPTTREERVTEHGQDQGIDKMSNTLQQTRISQYNTAAAWA